MKALLTLLAVTAIAFAAAKDFKEYAPAAEKIEKKYIKIQTENSKINVHYNYEFFPVTLFPFFCMDPDTLSRFVNTRATIKYFSDITIGVYEFKGEQHILMAVLNYVGHKSRPANYRTFSLFFMKQDPTSKEWVEEKESVSVTILLSNPEKEEYECKKPKK